MSIIYHSLGACREVTGSKHFIQTDSHLLQIDAGMFQGRRQESYEKNRDLLYDPSQVNALILTHAHYDHSGALPILYKHGFNGNIYSTSATRDIAQIILMDSAYIQKKDFEYLEEKAKKHPERKLKLYPPLYSSEDAVETMKQFVTINYHRPFIPVPGITATMYNSGHILGSALVHLQCENGLSIGFSGDLGRNNLPIIKDPEIFPDLDILVLEGTYGNRLHASIDLAQKALRETIRKALKRNGKVIIPAFTIERTQELIYLIHLMVVNKELPDIPIFIDSPMAINATSIFKIHPECYDQETIEKFTASNMNPFGFDQIHYTVSKRESMEINEIKGPAVIISASGMAESGRILHHLANHIENPDNIIAIVGFMAEHTLGRKLVEGSPTVKIFGKPYKVNAEIVTLNAFSGHADYQEILNWLHRHNLERLKKIFLVHGEDKALLNLKQLLKKEGLKNCEIVSCQKQYVLKN